MFKYAVCSFIAGKICFGLFAVKLGCFQCYCTGGKVVYQFAASYFDFTWSYSKQRFCLFSAKVRCFQHCVSENRLFFFFLVKLRFWPSKTIGKHVLVCWQGNWKFRTLYQKKQRFSFPRKLRCFKLYNTENMFWLVGTKIGFFELYIANTSDFAFCLLKHVALTQRFAVKMCCCQRYCTGKRFFSSLQRVTLLISWFYSKQRFFLSLVKWQRFASLWPG